MLLVAPVGGSYKLARFEKVPIDLPVSSTEYTLKHNWQGLVKGCYWMNPNNGSLVELIYEQDYMITNNTLTIFPSALTKINGGGYILLMEEYVTKLSFPDLSKGPFVTYYFIKPEEKVLYNVKVAVVVDEAVKNYIEAKILIINPETGDETEASELVIPVFEPQKPEFFGLIVSKKAEKMPFGVYIGAYLDITFEVGS